MNIFDYLDKNSVIVNIKQKNKRGVVTSIIDHLIKSKKINVDDKKSVVKIILQREEMGSTAIGSHIAFPHARVETVKNVLICIATSKEGVDFDSLDQEPVYVIALLLSNQKEAGLHLKTLAFLARMLRDKYLVQKLRNADTPEEILSSLLKQQQAVQ